MNLGHARTLAETKLREIEEAGLPLRMFGNEENGIQERSWCWIFWFNSEEFLESRDFLDSVLAGPIVVNKDESDVWVVGTRRPTEELLDEYAVKHGYESPSAQSSSQA